MEFRLRPEDVGFDRNSVLTVGSFDGVHAAHRSIIRTVVDRAAARRGRSVVVTFDPHPQHVLHPERPVGLLTTIDDRRRLCEALGVDVVCVVPFTYEFSQTPWEEFVEKVLVRLIGAAEMVEGFNHHFGRNREGGIEALRSVGTRLGFAVTMVDRIEHDGGPVSSTRIRRTLLDGDVEGAAGLLGRRYDLYGTVVHGDKRGAALGYPTANIAPDNPLKLVPGNGIYVVEVDLGESETRFGLASIGVRPTFLPDGPRTLEVFVLDFTGDLYGRRLGLKFLRRLREELKFDSREALIRQMDDDKKTALAYLSTTPL